MAETHPRPRTPWTLLGYAVIALLALAPRLAERGRFVTVDEVNFWISRSQEFLHALRHADPAATAISVHPGVTTMWLGTFGLLLRDWFGIDSGGTAQLLADLQLPVALVNGLAIVGGYALLRRLLPGPVALLAAGFWALDPFLIGYSRLLHTDALAASFGTLALLAAVAARGWRLAALSGACLALAVLSKMTVAALLPVVILALLWPGERRSTRLPLLLPWAVASIVMALVAWPALWAAPSEVVRLLRLGIVAEGAQPHQLGNFFLGRAYGDAEPGALFYPVALALRASPRVLLGLLALAIAFWPARHKLTPPALALIGVLALTVVSQTLALTFFAKKFNRYLLPAFPALNILAAIGVCLLVAVVVEWILRRRPRRSQFATSIILVAEIAGLGVALSRPVYAINAYNPWLGGTAAGAATFQSGWGEGLEQAAAWLNAQPDITGVTVIAARTETLQPFLRSGAQAVTPPDGRIPANAGYALVYIRDVQGSPPPAPLDQLYGRVAPVYTVEMLGVPWAWIYQIPPRFATPVNAHFGSSATLLGYTSTRDATTVHVRLVWRAEHATPASLFIHVLDGAGVRVAQADLPESATQWEKGRFYVTELTLAAPDGASQLLIGWYDPKTGERLPLRGADPLRSDNTVLLDVAVSDPVRLSGP